MSGIANFFKALASLAVLGVVALGSWVGYQAYSARDAVQRELRDQLRDKEQELTEAQGKVALLNERVSEQKKQIERLDTALRLLKVETRVAYLTVVDQWQPEGDARVQTRLTFVEVDNENQPLADPKTVTIEGDVVYVDAWVVKFDDKYVEQGDAFRSTSLCLFRRLFGEFQKPSDGHVLDSVGSRPAAYGRGDRLTTLEEQIWEDFWTYANSQAAAEKVGVRAAHGEAPSIKTEKGKSYKVTLRASGGLTIAPTDDAPKLAIPPDA